MLALALSRPVARGSAHRRRRWRRHRAHPRPRSRVLGRLSKWRTARVRPGTSVADTPLPAIAFTLKSPNRLLSRRFLGLIARDPNQYVWRRAAKRAARLIGLAGPWLRFAASTQGWLWVRRALDPWTGPARALGFVRRPHRADMGEYDKAGKHGTLVSVVPGRRWGMTGPVDDTRSSHARIFYASGDTYDGQMQNDCMHGRGIYMRAPHGALTVAMRIECFWMYDKRHGVVTVDIGCMCSDLAIHNDDGNQVLSTAPEEDAHVPSITQSCCGSHGTDPSRPYGYRATQLWGYGVMTGPCKVIYCSGDIFECEYDCGIATQVRMVLSPYCPDPRFRSVEIASPAWRRETVNRASSDQDSSTLFYPDPMASPDMFRVYHDYFRAGFLPVEEHDRSAVATVLNEAAAIVKT
nr:Morn repeat protein [Pandoravirus massiliensis]